MPETKRTRVNLLFRKRLPQFNSIEEIFMELYEYIRVKIPVVKIEVPCEGADVKSVYTNLMHIKKYKAKINHITGHINYAALVKKKTILTVHDIGSAIEGSYFRRFIIKTLWFWIPALLVKKITVISRFSQMELEKLVPFAKHKIQVIYNPVNTSLKFSPKKFCKQKPLILHLGTKPNKNLERTIKALEGVACRLLIIGALTTEQMELLDQCSIDYINKKFIPFSEIIAAYEECDMVSFVSLYEGFGMPVIEAQAVGRPVLSSKVCSIPEVAGGAACLVNPLDVKEIRQGILKIIKDDVYRAELITKGQQNIKRFQIEEIAEQYIQLYKKVNNA